MPRTGNVLVFYGSAGVVTDTSLSWEQVLRQRSSVDRGTRIREFTRGQESECVFDIELRGERSNQIRWAVYGGARVDCFGVETPRKEALR